MQHKVTPSASRSLKNASAERIGRETLEFLRIFSVITAALTLFWFDTPHAHR